LIESYEDDESPDLIISISKERAVLRGVHKGGFHSVLGGTRTVIGSHRIGRIS
jgi:hypothetical protein